MSEHVDERRIGRGLLSRVGLLALVALVGCGTKVSEEQTQALAKIRDLGGRVNFNRGGYEVDLKGTHVENADLANLRHIARLKNVDLTGTVVGDEGLAHLRAVPTLEIIYLRRTLATREGVDELKKAMPNTEILY